MSALSIRVALAVATAALLGSSCDLYTRDPLFCCVDLAECKADRAPDLVPCTKPGEVCDTTLDICVPDPSIDLCDQPTDCSAPRPACVDGQCVECGDDTACPATSPSCSPTHACQACEDETACARFADTPHCAPAGGCVECRMGTPGDCTEAGRPVCDSGACRACSAGSECASGICNLAGGSCVNEAEAVYVAKGGSDASPCSRSQPCASLRRGVAQASPTRPWILVAASAQPYEEDATVSIAGATLTILGQGATLTPTRNGTAALEISGAANVTIEGLRVANAGGTSGDGVICRNQNADSPTLTLRGVIIGNNGGQGVKATSCTLDIAGAAIELNTGGGISVTGGSATITRSSVARNTGGGISIAGGSATIINNMITANGGPGSSVGGVKLDSVSGLSFLFNTVGGNVTLSEAFAAGIQCSALSPVTLSNNIVHGAAASQVASPAPNCSFSFNLSNQALGGTNVSTTAPTASLFVQPDQGDYHLAAGNPAVGAASPSSTTDVDFDGDARPAPAGSRADIGADEIVQ
jgi:hypothetical protein